VEQAINTALEDTWTTNENDDNPPTTAMLPTMLPPGAMLQAFETMDVYKPSRLTNTTQLEVGRASYAHGLIDDGKNMQLAIGDK
jgi:hypothetical protein